MGTIVWLCSSSSSRTTPGNIICNQILSPHVFLGYADELENKWLYPSSCENFDNFEYFMKQKHFKNNQSKFQRYWKQRYKDNYALNDLGIDEKSDDDQENNVFENDNFDSNIKDGEKKTLTFLQNENDVQHYLTLLIPLFEEYYSSFDKIRDHGNFANNRSNSDTDS